MNDSFKPFGDLYKQRYDESFPEPYKFKKADWFQFAVWKKEHQEVTPQQFVELAITEWNKGLYKSGYSLSIAALCSNWSLLIAKNMHKLTIAKPKEYKF